MEIGNQKSYTFVYKGADTENIFSSIDDFKVFINWEISIIYEKVIEKMESLKEQIMNPPLKERSDNGGINEPVIDFTLLQKLNEYYGSMFDAATKGELTEEQAKRVDDLMNSVYNYIEN